MVDEIEARGNLVVVWWFDEVEIRSGQVWR